ncbi:hypothetical protein [Dokdonella sp.]|uniref:hypothetical protein n=1 Tax=Dokdonella sp. TaxID=2291710 RepID=UPI003526E941
MRKESIPKFELRDRLGADKERMIAVTGDLARTRLGVTPTALKNMTARSRISSILPRCMTFLPTKRLSQGQYRRHRHALQLAESLKAGCFPTHTSSIARPPDSVSGRLPRGHV